MKGLWLGECFVFERAQQSLFVRAKAMALNQSNWMFKGVFVVLLVEGTFPGIIDKVKFAMVKGGGKVVVSGGLDRKFPSCDVTHILAFSWDVINHKYKSNTTEWIALTMNTHVVSYNWALAYIKL